jgi:hypothetical protein
MSEIKTGGPAFPSPLWEGWGSPQEGMTLRDYFAAKAMQAAFTGMATRQVTLRYSECAALSYEMADAMLKAREA